MNTNGGGGWEGDAARKLLEVSVLGDTEHLPILTPETVHLIYD